MGRGRTNGVSQAVRFLGDLIALPSVNPAFLPQSDPNAGEAAITDYLTRRAAKAKLDVERQRVAPGSENLIVRLTSIGQPQHHIILAPHLDTVGVDSPDHEGRALDSDSPRRPLSSSDAPAAAPAPPVAAATALAECLVS